MQIFVAKPNFSQDFNKKVEIAKKKKAKILIDSVQNVIGISVYNGVRPIGRFSFVKDQDNYILNHKSIIEREFYPFEFMIWSLVKYLKRKKIQYICYNEK